MKHPIIPFGFTRERGTLVHFFMFEFSKKPFFKDYHLSQQQQQVVLKFWSFGGTKNIGIPVSTTTLVVNSSESIKSVVVLPIYHFLMQISA